MSSLWHRVDADPDLTAAVRAVVDGRDDALDLLWWSEHPGRPTPAGVPDPGVALERDRRALYRADGGAADSRSVVRAAASYAESKERVAAAARAAVAAREAQQREAAGPPRAPAPASDPPPATGRGRRWPLTVLAAGAALAAGVALGVLAAGGPQSGGGDHAAVRSLQVFDRRQDATFDVPPETDEVPIVERRTIRRLRADPTIGTTLYAARAEGGRVCVFVVVLADPSPPACTTVAAFANGGLTLLIRATADPTDDTGRRPIDELTLTWNPNGTVAITPVEVGTLPPGASADATES